MATVERAFPRHEHHGLPSSPTIKQGACESLLLSQQVQGSWGTLASRPLQLDHTS